MIHKAEDKADDHRLRTRQLLHRVENIVDDRQLLEKRDNTQ
jgi:hypothetical protein